MKPTVADLERVSSKFKLLDNGCWEWEANKNRQGYAQISMRGSLFTPRKRRSWTTKVATLLFEATQGTTVPKGMHLDHLCRNTSCVNPMHLEVVTPKENILRSTGVAAVNSKKTECPYGHPLSGDNLYLINRPNNRIQRTCRICAISATERYNLRKKVEKLLLRGLALKEDEALQEGLNDLD